MTDIRAMLPAGGGPLAAPATGLYVQTFGGFCLYRDGRPVPAGAWRRHDAKVVLVRLLAVGGRPLPKAQLMGSLWPDVADDAAANRLRVVLHTLRRILEPGLPAYGPSRFLTSTRYECGIVDHPELRWDGGALLAALAAADAASGPGDELEALEAGLTDVRGEWLPEFDGCGEFAAMRWQWNALAVGAAMRAADLALGLGRAPVARWAAECAATIDPGSERAYALMLAALASTGVPGQVRRAFAYACDRLRECTDTEPGPDLRRAAAEALAVASGSVQRRLGPR